MSRFVDIINDALSDAENVRVPFADYVAGLREMKELLDERLAMVEDELSNRGDE